MRQSCHYIAHIGSFAGGLRCRICSQAYLRNRVEILRRRHGERAEGQHFVNRTAGALQAPDKLTTDAASSYLRTDQSSTKVRCQIGKLSISGMHYTNCETLMLTSGGRTRRLPIFLSGHLGCRRYSWARRRCVFSLSGPILPTSIWCGNYLCVPWDREPATSSRSFQSQRFWSASCTL